MRKVIICVLAVLILTGCAKVTRREYHAEPVTVLSVDYTAAYQTISTDGKDIYTVNHPEDYDAIVIWQGKQVDIDTAAAYVICKYKLGSEVWAVVETRIYDNDKQKQKLLEVFETKETAERVCKAYMEGE
jgi:hypothetical protein